MSDDSRVMEMVRKQLERDPPPSTAALYGRAVRLDPKIRDLSLQQFNAKFPLQVKRRRTLARKRKERAEADRAPASREERPGRRTGGERMAAERAKRIRAVLIQYARALLKAESAAEIVDLFAGLDLYVDAIADAARGEPQGLPTA